MEMRPSPLLWLPGIVLMVSACSGESSATDGGPARDAGRRIRDAGSTTTRDGGSVDGGFRDAGSGDAGPMRDGGEPWCGNGVCDVGENIANCPQDCTPQNAPGTEGYECHSTWPSDATPFLQDDCDPNLICVAWDRHLGRAGPFELDTCVRPCVVDADCGPNRTCSGDFDLAASTGVDRICVDAVADVAQPCGGSRVEDRHTKTTVTTPGRIVGCAPEQTCFVGINLADEGVCAQSCEASTECASAATPYCNPQALTRVRFDATDTIGICSTAKRDSGARCRGLIDQCDTATDTPALDCIRDFCVETCEVGVTGCTGVDPTLGPRQCTQTTILAVGLCLEPACNLFPDTCSGPGAEGLGRYCHELDPQNGICVDRRPTIRGVSAVDSSGNVTQGDNCWLGFASHDRCVDGTACIATGRASGACLIGCDPNDANYCSTALSALGLSTVNATCVAAATDPTSFVCGSD